MIEFFSEPFILRVLLAGIAISIVFGALGCFAVWRKMAYFGDSLAHSSLLGIALGLLLGVNVNVGIILVCALFAVILTYLQQKKFLATDSLLGILAHASLSLGMVVISFLKGDDNADVHNYLFGDILNITTNDVYLIYGVVAIIMILLVKNWQSLNLVTICEDLARAEGVKVFYSQLLLMFLMTMIVAVSINIIGILLITSMMIIPAANARGFAKSPETMAIISAIFAIIAVIMGISFSSYFEVSSGPSIVVSSVVLFIFSSLASLFKQAFQK